MKRFFSFFFASCLGTLAALAVIVLAVSVFFSISTKSDTKIDPNSVLVLKFENFIPEKTNNISEDPYSFQDVEFIGLRQIKRLINHAASDDKISGIVLEPTYSMQDQVKIGNLREALMSFKESGKFVMAYSDFYTQSGYQISSMADSVFLNPNGGIDFRGFAFMYPFYKDAMDKLGVEMNIYYAGDFKSATEPYRRNSMSEENKLQSREFIQEITNNLVQTISSDRGLDVKNLNRLKNTYEAYDSKNALSSGLVDGLIYKDEFESMIKGKLGLEDSKKIKYIELDEYSSKTKLSNGTAKDRIAIVYAEGEITYGDKKNGVISDGNYIKLIEKLRKKDNIKAIVLRINSPGGSGFSSDVIWRELEQTSNSGKPIIASMSSYAASGGYYIACMADTIVAEPHTLTGSIGVFVMFPNVKELMGEKLGIQFDTVASSPYAVGFNPFFDLTQDQNKLMQSMTDKLYDQFLERVADGRDMNKEEVHQIAQGRVWSGAKAQKLGLVDEIGDLEDAIEIAAAKAGLEDYKVVEYPTIKENPWKELVKAFGSEMKLGGQKLSKDFTKYYPVYQEMKKWLEYDHPQARLPLFFM